jgi:diamine N-acetyltransferase
MAQRVLTAVRIRRAQAGDAAGLSEFAERLFRETFEDTNEPEDMAAYLAEAFGIERQKAEIEDPSSIVRLAEDFADLAESDGVTPTPAALAGYSHLSGGELPASVDGPMPLELKRFYIDRVWHGSGLAQVLMRATFDAALASGARTLWLGVWEHNPRAIAFYRKFGFAEAGSHDFMLGRDRQTDIIMVRPMTTGTTA